MRTCSTCGHVTWHTAGIRACGTCDLMGEWPRINGTAVTVECPNCGSDNPDVRHNACCGVVPDPWHAVGVDRTRHASAGNPPYDWANDGPWTIEGGEVGQ